MQNSPETLKIKAAVFTVFAIVMITVWNLWLHKFPALMLGIAGSEAAPAPLPTLPWPVLVLVASIGLFYISLVTLAESVAKARANREGGGRA